MYYDNNFALVIPMANEEREFETFASEIAVVLNRLKSGTVYFIVDNANKKRIKLL